jgi:Clp amino terminal domain, pathogenicity island component
MTEHARMSEDAVVVAMAAYEHALRLGHEHLALGVLASTAGPVPSILSALGVSAAQLRVAILDRYRQAD